MGVTATLLVSGLIRALWHFPLTIFSVYGGERGRGAWYAGEFGAGLAFATAIIAVATLVRARGGTEMVGDAAIRRDSPAR